MKFIIDRFEENIAVLECENDSMLNLDKKFLPNGAKEGDVLELMICSEETVDRKKKIDDMFDSLF